MGQPPVACRVVLLMLVLLVIAPGIHSTGMAMAQSATPHPVLRLDSANVLPGHNATITLTLENCPTFGQFELFVAYQSPELNFLGADPLGILSDWEYFTFRTSVWDTCGGSCPMRLIRLIGMANMPDGRTPDPAVYTPEGPIIELTFGTPSDLEYICDCFELNWAWIGCKDNVLNSIHGDSLYFAHDIQDVLPDENCLGADGSHNIPILQFESGKICIGAPSEGEGNLNDDGKIDGADVVYWIDYIFHGGPEPGGSPYGCHGECLADFNCDGRLNLIDIAALVRYVYRQPAPRPCDPCQ